MKQEQIEEAMKELDLTDVAHKLSQMALKVLSGGEIKEKTYSVPLSIPEELAEVFELLAEKSGVKVEEMLGNMAKSGYEASLKQLIQQQQPVSTPPPPPQTNEMPEQLNGLLNKMNQLQGVVGKLQEMQKAIESANNQTTPQPNPGEPVVPSHQVPCKKPSGEK